MPAIPNSYTSDEALQALYGKAFDASIVPNVGQVHEAAVQIANEINAYLGVMYQVPLVEASSPIAYKAVAYGNALGTLYLVHAMEYSQASDRASNPWAAPWKDWLKTLGSMELPDALDLDVEDIPSLLVRIRAWAEAVATGGRVTAVRYAPATRTITFTLIDDSGVENTLNITIPSGGQGGGLDRVDVLAIINEAVEEFAVKNNDELPVIADFGDASTAQIGWVLAVGSDGFTEWIAQPQADWATKGNTDQIPADKLGNVATHPAVVDLSNSEEGLRFEESLFNGTVPIALSERASPFPNPNPDVPPAADARRLRVVIGGQSHTLTVSELLGKPATSNGDQLTAANSVAFSLSNTQYYLGHTGGATPKFLLAWENSTNVTLQLFDNQIDLEDFARRSSTAQVPDAKLPDIPTNAEIDARADARVAAGVSDWAEEGDTSQIPLNKLGNAPSGGGGGLTQAQVDARVAAGVSDWAEEGNTDQVPSNKLGNVPARGLNQNEANALITAGVNRLVNAIALTGNTARWGWDKLVAGLQGFYNALNPYLRQLEALGKDVETGGWRTSTGVTVAPLQTTDPTLQTIRGLTYSARLPEQTPALGTQRWVILRTERSVLGGRPDATDLRVVIDDGLIEALDSYAGASADSPVTYDYWKLHLTPQGAGQISVPEGAEIFGEWYGPTEFGDNIRFPAAALQGNIPANRITGLPGAGNIELQDGAVGGIAITSGYDADVLGVRAAFSPAFDMDTHTHGIVDCSLRLNIVGASVPAGTVGFESIPPRTSTAATTQITVSGFVSINDLIDSDEWVAGGAQEGLKVVEQELYEGSNVVGTLELWLSRDADNNLYRQLVYNAGSTGTSGSVTIGAHLVAFAQVTGGASAGGGTPAPAAGWTRAGGVTNVTGSQSNWVDTGINLGTVSEVNSRMYNIAFNLNARGTACLTVHGSILAQDINEATTPQSENGVIVRWRPAGFNAMYVSVNAARNLMIATASLPGTIPAIDAWYMAA